MDSKKEFVDRARQKLVEWGEGGAVPASEAKEWLEIALTYMGVDLDAPNCGTCRDTGERYPEDSTSDEPCPDCEEGRALARALSRPPLIPRLTEEGNPMMGSLMELTGVLYGVRGRYPDRSERHDEIVRAVRNIQIAQGRQDEELFDAAMERARKVLERYVPGVRGMTVDQLENEIESLVGVLESEEE